MARSWLTTEGEKVRERTRYQQAGELRGSGLSIPEVAEQMEVTTGTAAKFIEHARCQEAIRAGAPEVGVDELTERMCRVYPRDERRDWIRVEMARWSELRELNRRRKR